MSVESLNEILASGTAPLVLEYYPINNFSSSFSTPVGLRTVVRVNSTDLGALYPPQYRIVSNRTAQSSRLSSWAFARFLEQAEGLIDEADEDFFITVYFPGRMLVKPELDKLLGSVPEEKQGLLSHLVCEFSSDVLLLGEPELKNSLTAVKNKYGVRLMLSEYGDEFCPVLRLNGLPFDYVVLDKSISSPEALNTINVSSVIQLVKDLSMKCVLENGYGQDFQSAGNSGCDYYCSDTLITPKGVA